MILELHDIPISSKDIVSSQGEAEGSEKSENVLNENYCMHNQTTESVSNENVLCKGYLLGKNTFVLY